MKSIKFKDLDKLNEILNKYSKEERIDLLNSINHLMEDSYNYLHSRDWSITTSGGNPIYNIRCVALDRYVKLGLSREGLRKPLDCDSHHHLDELILVSNGDWYSHYNKDASLNLFVVNLLEMFITIEKQKGFQIVKILGYTGQPCKSNDKGEPILNKDSTNQGLVLQLSNGTYWFLWRKNNEVLCNL
jgi:hypothetical protein